MKDRNVASKDLYRPLWKQIDLLGAEPPITILEVGCGTGAGLALLLDELGSIKDSTFIGQDITCEQLQHAQARLKQSHLRAVVRLVSDLTGLDSASVDVLYSVETLQTIDDLEGFVQQAARLLEPKAGKLALTMHLCPRPERYHWLRGLTPTCPSPDLMTPLPVLSNALINHGGFADVNVQSIGRYVFEACGAWARLVDEEVVRA
jgi:ubiquinone/menaquinone biosynthesis C-methylase UbiE